LGFADPLLWLSMLNYITGKPHLSRRSFPIRMKRQLIR
jgi:hypothetical protein